MQKINFTKIVTSGNDFIITDNRYQTIDIRQLKLLARQICNRKYGIGADGLLVLDKSKKADIRMRIFNPDGSQAQMCGNGARCVALYATGYTLNAKHKITIETKAGIIESEVVQDNVKIKLTEPKGIKTDINIQINHRSLKVNFINTGVPHTVIFVHGIDKIDVLNLGRKIRYHKRFSPQGTNVDFVEVLNNNSIKVRTYERGVEDETLACGTGAVASALLYALRHTLHAMRRVNIITKSGEALKVCFNKIENEFDDIWLEGKVKIVCKGVYYV